MTLLCLAAPPSLVATPTYANTIPGLASLVALAADG